MRDKIQHWIETWGLLVFGILMALETLLFKIG